MSEQQTIHPPPPIASLINLAGRVVVVTGAARGIGAGVAIRLAEAGAAVAVADLEPEGAADTADRITSARGRAVAVAMDVRLQASVEAGLQQAVAALGPLHGLVNCAGIQPLAGILAMSSADWDEMMAVNLRGVFLATQAAARRLIEQGSGGAIVNIASIEGTQPAWLHSHYCTTKAAVLMHTRAAALELGRHGIRVNSVSPGLIWSPVLEQAWPEGVRRFLDHAPLGRLGQPDDIADAVLYLLSPMSRFVTGANLVVDGGVLAHPTW